MNDKPQNPPKQKQPKSSGRKVPSTGTPRAARVKWWHIAIITILAAACYFQAAGYGFVYDDNVQIVRNPRIRSFANLKLAFTENFWAFASANSSTNYYRPLQTVTYMMGYALDGISPSVFHWINIALHILASLAVFWLGMELLGSPTVALWGALFFCTHPMHTESVAWVAGITDVGCGLFYFISLAAYLRYRKGGSRQDLHIAISLAAFLLALFYKEMALTLPVAVFLADYASEGKGARILDSNRLWRLTPFLGALAAYLILRIHALGAFSRTTVALPIGAVDRILTTLYFVCRYVQDLLLPIRQNPYHVFVPFSRLALREWLPGILLAAACAYFVRRVVRQDKRLAFLATFIVLAILPVLNLSGIGQNVYSERYLYIPSAGFCLLVAGLFGRYSGKKEFVVAIQAGIVLLLGLLTIGRHHIWQDDKTFCMETLAVSPDAVSMRNNLGKILFSEGDLEAARETFQAALISESRVFVRVPRERAISLLGMSAVASEQGNLEDAWKWAVEARDLVPTLGDAYQSMGAIMLKQDRAAEAEGLLRRAVELEPGNAVAHANLGTSLFMQNDVPSAESELRRSIELDPSLAGPRVALASLLYETDRIIEARSLLQEALKLDPGNSQARQLLHQVNARPP